MWTSSPTTPLLDLGLGARINDAKTSSGASPSAMTLPSIMLM
jgi:hypothetical protein